MNYKKTGFKGRVDAVAASAVHSFAIGFAMLWAIGKQFIMFP